MAFPLLHPNIPTSVFSPITAPEFDAQPSFQNFQNPWLSLPQSQPLKQGALEYSDEFKKAAARAWMAAAGGLKRSESGFWIANNGQGGPISTWLDTKDGHPSARMDLPTEAMGLYHTHPNYANASPSSTDINSVRQAHTSMYVGSRDGLYGIDPGGQVTHIFSDPYWMTSKNPR